MRASLTAVVVVCIATLSVVGCSQSTLPTVPSSATSVASSSLGPGASYQATGTWRFVTVNADGNVEETFETHVSQDGNGNLSFLNGDGELVMLERLGTGVIITYSLSVTSVESGCDAVHVRGLARLDTNTNTMTLPIRLRGCSQTEGFVVTGTKLS
jgi:hypothetical protein